MVARVSRAMSPDFFAATRLPLQGTELHAGEDRYFLWFACGGTRVARNFWYGACRIRLLSLRSQRDKEAAPEV